MAADLVAEQVKRRLDRDRVRLHLQQLVGRRERRVDLAARARRRRPSVAAHLLGDLRADDVRVDADAADPPSSRNGCISLSSPAYRSRPVSTMCRASSRSSFACLTARTVSISASRVIVSGSMFTTTRARDVVDDDRQVARSRRSPRSARRSRAAAACCSTASTTRKPSTPSSCACSVRCDRVRGRVRAGAGDDGSRRPPTASSAARTRSSRSRVRERRALARRAGDDDAVGAVLDEMPARAPGTRRSRPRRRRETASRSRSGRCRASRDSTAASATILRRWRGSFSSTGPGTAPGASNGRPRTVCGRRGHTARSTRPAVRRSRRSTRMTTHAFSERSPMPSSSATRSAGQTIVPPSKPRVRVYLAAILPVEGAYCRVQPGRVRRVRARSARAVVLAGRRHRRCTPLPGLPPRRTSTGRSRGCARRHVLTRRSRRSDPEMWCWRPVMTSRSIPPGRCGSVASTARASRSWTPGTSRCSRTRESWPISSSASAAEGPAETGVELVAPFPAQTRVEAQLHR